VTKKRRNSQTPWVTVVIAVLCMLNMAFVWFLSMDNTADAEILAGAYYKPMILAGEWLRLLTAGFVHANILHLAMNLYSFYFLGRMMEGTMPRYMYLLLVAVSVVMGNLFVFAAEGNEVCVGLSGGIYGVLGSYLLLMFVSGMYKNKRFLAQITHTLVINLLLNFLPGVAWRAHLGGFIGGMMFSALFLKSPVIRPHLIHFRVCTACVLVLLGFMCWKNAYIPEDERYYGTDLNVLHKEEDLGFGNYAVNMVEKLDTLYDLDGLLVSAYEGGIY